MNYAEAFKKALLRIEQEKIKKAGKLDLRDLNLSILPAEIANLTHLTELNLTGNQLKKVDNIQYLINLETLNLSRNRIQEINFIKYLKKLKIVFLSRNRISDISPIKDLPQLEQLFLGHNQVLDINHIRHLQELRLIDLESNGIDDIKPLYSLENLRFILLSENKITDISPLSELKYIEWLYVDDNPITSIPEQFVENTKGKYYWSNAFTGYKGIYFYNNPLPPEVIEAIQSGGREGLLKLLEEKEKGTVCIKEAKLMLLGMPRSGKTSLRRYLLNGSMNASEKSTEKIEIENWQEEDYTFHIWDFGGQEMLYDLHRFFLTEDCLYVIVLDASTDQQPDKYLEFIESYAPNAPFYVLFNKADVATATSKIDNYHQLKDRFPRTFKGVFERVSLTEASAGNAQYLQIAEQIREQLLNGLKALPHVQREYAQSYAHLKQAVERYYDRENAPYLTHSVYKALCQEYLINDDDKLILAFLNTLGVVRYYGQDPHLRHLHIMNPEWVIEAAYFLLVSDFVKQRRGVLSWADTEQLLKSKRNNSRFHYEEAEIDYLLQLLQKFNIIYYDQAAQLVYLPLHFGNDQPQQFREFREASYRFYFDFESDVPNYIISALIATKFGEVVEHLYWNKGAMLQPAPEVQVLIEQSDKRRIDFWIQGKFFQLYFVALRANLMEILRPLVGLKFEEKIAVKQNGHTIVLDVETLQAYAREGEGRFRDIKTKEWVDVQKVMGIYFTKQSIMNMNITNNNYGHTQIFQSENINFFGSDWMAHFSQIEESEAKKQLQQDLVDFETAPKEKKKSLAKRISEGIKGVFKTAKDEATKEAVKKLLPEIAEEVGEWADKVEWQQVLNLINPI